MVLEVENLEVMRTCAERMLENMLKVQRVAAYVLRLVKLIAAF